MKRSWQSNWFEILLSYLNPGKDQSGQNSSQIGRHQSNNSPTHSLPLVSSWFNLTWTFYQGREIFMHLIVWVCWNLNCFSASFISFYFLFWLLVELSWFSAFQKWIVWRCLCISRVKGSSRARCIIGCTKKNLFVEFCNVLWTIAAKWWIWWMAPQKVSNL